MKTSIGLAAVVALALLSAACDKESSRDIRAPLKGRMVVTKDLTAETKLPSAALNQTLEASAQNKGVMVQIIVKKGSALGPEVERQVAKRHLEDRVQLIER